MASFKYKDENGNWQKLNNLVGPPGPKGDPGPQGEPGQTTAYYTGQGIEITEGNIINVLKASSDVLGGIKVGDNLSIDEDGTLSSSNDNILPIYSNNTNDIKYLSDLPDGIFAISGKWRNNPMTTFDLSTWDTELILIIKYNGKGFMLQKKGVSDPAVFNYITQVSSNYTSSGTSNTYWLYTPSNNLTTTSAGRPLDAVQGKALKDLIDGLQTQINNLPSGGGGGGIPMLTGTSSDPIKLYELADGAYIIKGYHRQSDSASGIDSNITHPVLYVKSGSTNMGIGLDPTRPGYLHAYYFGSVGMDQSTVLWDTPLKKPVDDLTSTDKTSPLSANQGKALKDLVDALQEQVDNLPTSGGGEVNYINAIHSDKDKFIEDLEIGKFYYLTGDWYYKKDNATGSADVNFGSGYIGYVTNPYTDTYRFEGICFDSAWGIKTIEILDIYGSPSSMFGRVREPVDNLTTDYGDIALSARQGMVLKGLCDGLQEQVNNINPELPVATSEVLGGVKIGTDLKVNEDGQLTINKFIVADENRLPYLSSLEDGVYLLHGEFLYGKASSTKYYSASHCMFVKCGSSAYTYRFSGDGRIMYDYFSGLNTWDELTNYMYASKSVIIGNVIDNLNGGTNSIGSYQPLSAKQGKVLNDKITGLQTQVDGISVPTILSGTSDPTSDIGNDGDIYFQYTE